MTWRVVIAYYNLCYYCYVVNVIVKHNIIYTYEARPLQRRRGGAQHAQTYVIVDDAGTLEVWQDFHGQFLQRGTWVARRECSDPPSHDRAFLAHIRVAWCICAHTIIYEI